MSENLYVKIRGRVHGPFEHPKLRTMVQSGQLSRVHLVSPDSQNWQRASDFPELFESNRPVQKVEPAEPRSSQGTQYSQGPSEPSQSSPAARASQTPGDLWYYSINGEEVPDPVSKMQLMNLIRQKVVYSHDMVWRQGLEQWTRISNIPELSTPMPEVLAPTSVKDGTVSMGHGIVHMTGDSRPWLLVTASLMFLLCGLQAIGGIWLIATGSKLGLSAVVAQGVTGLILSANLCFGAILLLKIASTISMFKLTKTETGLYHVMRAKKAFWIYAGVNSIISLVALIILIIWIFAFATTLPQF